MEPGSVMGEKEYRCSASQRCPQVCGLELGDKLGILSLSVTVTFLPCSWEGAGNFSALGIMCEHQSQLRLPWAELMILHSKEQLAG